MTDTDLRARLDAAITAARKDIGRCIEREKQGDTLYAQVRTAETIDRYGDLRELRARWGVVARLAEAGDEMAGVELMYIEADVRRLLEIKDGNASN